MNLELLDPNVLSVPDRIELSLCAKEDLPYCHVRYSTETHHQPNLPRPKRGGGARRTSMSSSGSSSSPARARGFGVQGGDAAQGQGAGVKRRRGGESGMAAEQYGEAQYMAVDAPGMHLHPSSNPTAGALSEPSVAMDGGSGGGGREGGAPSDAEMVATCLAFNHRGTYLAIGWTPGDVAIFDMFTRSVACRIEGTHDLPITGLSWSRDSRHVLTGSYDKRLRIWRLLSGAARALLSSSTTSVSHAHGVLEAEAEADEPIITARLHPRFRWDGKGKGGTEARIALVVTISNKLLIAHFHAASHKPINGNHIYASNGPASAVTEAAAAGGPLVVLQRVDLMHPQRPRVLSAIFDHSGKHILVGSHRNGVLTISTSLSTTTTPAAAAPTTDLTTNPTHTTPPASPPSSPTSTCPPSPSSTSSRASAPASAGGAVGGGGAHHSVAAVGIRSLVLSRDGAWVAGITGHNRIIRVMSVGRDTAQLGPAKDFQDVIDTRVQWRECCFAGCSGERLVGGTKRSYMYELHIWAREEGVLLHRLEGPKVELLTMAYHPYRPFLAVASSPPPHVPYQHAAQAAAPPSMTDDDNGASGPFTPEDASRPSGGIGGPGTSIDDRGAGEPSAAEEASRPSGGMGGPDTSIDDRGAGEPSAAEEASRPSGGMGGPVTSIGGSGGGGGGGGTPGSGGKNAGGASAMSLSTPSIGFGSGCSAADLMMGPVQFWGTDPNSNWTAYAPDFQELDENIEYIEREDEFDEKVMDLRLPSESRDAAGENSRDRDMETEDVNVEDVYKVAAFLSDDSDEEREPFFVPTDMNSLVQKGRVVLGMRL